MEPFIISLLRSAAESGRSLERIAVDEAQVNWAIRTGFGPLLYDRALNAPGLIPRASSRVLLVSELAARADSKRRRTAMIQIIDACSSSVSELTILKGISVCDEYYPKSHWRPMADIDFLVPEADLGRAESALRGLGYRQVSPCPAEFYAMHHHSMPFQDPKTGVAVEIHTALFPNGTPLSQSRAFRLPNIVAHLRPSGFQGRAIYRLSNELQLAYLACHALVERRVFNTLIPFLDVIFLLRQAGRELNWHTVLDWLDDRTVSAYLCVMLAYLERHRVVPFPPAVHAALLAAKRRLGRLTLALIHRSMDRYAAHGQSMDDILGRDNRFVAWETLLAPRSPLLNLLLIPWNLAFPPSNPDRFRVRFQLERVRSVYRRARR